MSGVEIGSIAERLKVIEEKIQRACSAAGRSSKDVTLVAVSKKKSAQQIIEAVQAGQLTFGENYLQEALPKILEVSEFCTENKMFELQWHFIGHLQSKKAKSAFEHFSLLHSLDTTSLAQKLNSVARDQSNSARALVQINIDKESTKNGLLENELISFLEECAPLTSLTIEGLMTIPSPTLQEKDPKRSFAQTRELMEQVNARNCYPQPLKELSMGMSMDYEAAVSEGSTIVRVGTAIFGAREPK